MPSFLLRYFPIFVLTGAFVAVVMLYLKLKWENVPPPPEVPETVETVETETLPEKPALSPLAQPPDWQSLAPFQRTITRADFERLLTTVFTVGENWKNYILLTETNAVIKTTDGGIFILQFADEPTPFPKNWKATSELPAAPADKPLQDLHIAIDPGHIGGEWAKMEERWFIHDGGTPVTEGDMTLAVAKLLKPKLEALGARVSLVRDKPEPVTAVRPDALMQDAEATTASQEPESISRLAQRLFYRTAEIHARAEIVNNEIKPDIVLCLHFNAEAWGDPNAPTLIPRTHLHLILNGAYNSEEVALADQRFTMIKKLLSHTHEEEAFVGSTIADTYAEISQLPPYVYPPGGSVLSVGGHPFLWARNLLANRLYDCPVIYMEPYVMNSSQDYARIQAGDYDGVKEIEGQLRPSIFREYADALAEGLRRHYSANRPKAD
jgi:N-acetylmuramoyl-L-alanine amidase